MLLLNYRTKIWKKSRAEWTENNKEKNTEGIDNPGKKKLYGQFFCPDNFFCPNKRAFTTK